jgi:hypothetical protein
MSPINRRKFLISSVAVTAATALAPHLLVTPSEVALQASEPALPEAGAIPGVQLQSAGHRDFINWRQQGLNLGGRTAHHRHYLM